MLDKAFYDYLTLTKAFSFFAFDSIFIAIQCSVFRFLDFVHFAYFLILILGSTTP